MTSKTVDRYFERLERELADLPPQRRHDLIEEIRDHVEQALAAETDPSEADVRNVLDRLGDPAEIASEARERSGLRRTSASWTDWAAVVLLPFGGLLIFIPFLGVLGALGWVAGAILILISRVFSARDKAMGILLFPGGLLLPMILLVAGGQVCTGSTESGQTATCTGFSLPPVLGIPLLIALVVTPLIVGVHLGSKLRTLSEEGTS